MTNIKEALKEVASSTKSYLKGEWQKSGYNTWTATDPNFGTVLIKVESKTSYALSGRLRIPSKTRNRLIVEIGTKEVRWGLENGQTVMEVTRLGEGREVTDKLKETVSKRLKARFGIEF